MHPPVNYDRRCGPADSSAMNIGHDKEKPIHKGMDFIKERMRCMT